MEGFKYWVILPGILLLAGCANDYDPAYPKEVVKVNNKIIAKFAGSIESLYPENIAIKKGCFTCEKIEISVQGCKTLNNTNVCTEYASNGMSNLEITYPASTPSGKYLLIIGEGAVYGFVSDYELIGGDKTQKNFPSDPGLFVFDIP